MTARPDVAHDQPAPVTVVATTGIASMDRYGQQLAAALGLPRLDLDISAATADGFGRPTTPARLAADLAIVRRLRAVSGLLHLTHHHTARYALALQRPCVVTAHDLIRWFDLTAVQPLIARPRGLARLALRADYAGMRAAAHVIAPSEATRSDLLQHLGFPADRVSVVPEAVDSALFRPVAPRAAPWPYVLVVGSEHPRKNLDAVLRAFALLKSRAGNEGLRLVKLGEPGDGEAPFGARTQALLGELGLEREVVLPGRVPDEDLPGWYAGALCLLMPSWAEGFGLPPLEAMACGTPSVVSTAGSLPEVVGDAGLVVPPDDIPGIADAVERLHTDDVLRSTLRARGLRRAPQFTWQRVARETQQVYASVLGQQEQVRR